MPTGVHNSHYIGGAKIAKKLLARDPDFYRRIGAKGGRGGTGTGKGFAANPELASTAGAKGGKTTWERKRAADALAK